VGPWLRPSPVGRADDGVGRGYGAARPHERTVADSAPSDLRPRLDVGRFRLVEPIGRGAFAEVWRAVHGSGTPVAIKFAHRNAARALDREAQRIAELDHPGIVQVYDHGTLGGRPWLALELAQGTLAATRSPLPLRELVAHLLRALAYLHARSILHRDVKPSNILVGCAPRVAWDSADRSGVRLADFGIAWAGDEGGPLSGGTPGWASPEQAANLPTSREPHVDLYGLARIVEHLLEGRDEGPWGPWLARALHADPGQRFSSAAHALAVLPPASESPPTTTASLDAETQPVLARIDVGSSRERPPPAPIVETPWPAVPPLAPLRVPKVALLDTGLSLVPHRPASLAGRLPLLLELWRDLVASRDVSVRGDDDDVAEVMGTLERWAREIGRTLTVRRSPEGREVPPLSTSAIAARLGGLGFEPVTAMRLAHRGRTWTEVRADLEALVAAGRVSISDDGLTVPDLPSPSASQDLVARIDEAWWTNDGAAMADTAAEVEAATGEAATWSPERRAWQRMLCRARVENPDDADLARDLLSASRAARLAGELHLAEGLACSGIGILNRARQAREALDAMDALPPPNDPRIAARLALARGFVGFQLNHPDTEAWLQTAAAVHDGRFAAYALATEADLELRRGALDRALDKARTAVERAAHAPPEDAVAAHLALANVLVARRAPDSDVTVILETARPFAQATANLAVQARFQLFCAQLAMREQRWGDADLLLSAAQELSCRRGSPATVIVLNHGLVALHRGDLASIPAITPEDWCTRIERSPPYLRGLLELHQLFVALGTGERAAIESALGVLEARSEKLAAVTAEPIARAATLAPDEYRRRIAALSTA